MTISFPLVKGICVLAVDDVNGELLYAEKKQL